jgi:hypothetical protein
MKPVPMNPVSDIEERTAWDQYAASVLASADISRPDLAAELAAKCADAMLEERRKRAGGAK